jgi:hypothetical protein
MMPVRQTRDREPESNAVKPAAKTQSNSEAARLAGVHPALLGRWLATGRLLRPQMVVIRGRIVRLWTEADIERIRAYKEAVGHDRVGHKSSPVATSVAERGGND